jgi:putative ABC transport system substrate-binding protein
LFAVVGCSGSAEQKAKPVVGIVNLSPVMDAIVDGFKAGMADLGYVEGQTVEYVYDGPTLEIDALAPAVERLKKRGVDMIFSLTTPATLKVKEAVKGTDIPVVFCPVNDPVQSGIVDSLRRPGGNLTGVKVGGFVPRGLDWLLRIVPEVKTVCVLHKPSDKSSVVGLAELKEAASALGVRLIVREVESGEAVLEACVNAPSETDAIVLLPSGPLESYAGLIAEAANKRRLPTLAPSPATGRNGLMIAFGMDFRPAGKQAARLANKVLTGTKPSDLPVETADFYLLINLKTANACGIEIPEEMLRQANEIVR